MVSVAMRYFDLSSQLSSVWCYHQIEVSLVTTEQAITVFAHGFSFTRSRTKPAEVARLESMTIMRDVRHDHPEARNQELIFGNASIEEAAQVIAEYQPPKHKLCWIVSPDVSDEDACAQVKSLGYR
jgi:hypothetical protein